MFDQLLEDHETEPKKREKAIVENSFWLAAEQTGIKASQDNINYM